MKLLRLLVSIALWFGTPVAAATVVKGNLERRAQLGFQMAQEKEQLRITETIVGSPAERAGLRSGDILLAVNGRNFTQPHEGIALLQRLRGGREAALSLTRGGQPASVRFVPVAEPLEDEEAVDTEYGVVRTRDGAVLRTILTRPSATNRRLPALLLTQWVSCNSLEAKGPSVDQLKGLATRAGMLLVRVERSGAGDSLGPACHELDYDTEVEHYRQAFDQLVKHPWVDPNKVVIYGNSLGGTTAPLVAQGRTLAGIMVQGGGAVSYFERMMGFDRLYLERGVKAPPGEVDRRMRRTAAFQVEYLLRGKSPEQIARERPELAGTWSQIRGTGEGVHYGRPLAWHQQAAQKNFLEAWSNLTVPVLVVYGQFDQFETRHGHKLIVDTLNGLRPGSATFIEIANADHELDIYANAEDAYAYRNGVAAPELFLQPAVSWLKNVIGSSK
jgi:pimeloyl-ACP methyl ester carboxylesterase